MTTITRPVRALGHNRSMPTHYVKFSFAFCLLAGSTLAQAAIVNVGGANQAFAPQTITINVGATVTFINKGGTHNVVADDNSFRCAHGCDGDGPGGAGVGGRNWQGVNANIRARGGSAMARGAMGDAEVVMRENAHKQLEAWNHENPERHPTAAEQARLIAEAKTAVETRDL